MEGDMLCVVKSRWVLLTVVLAACSAGPQGPQHRHIDNTPRFTIATTPEDAPGPCSACGPLVLVVLEDSGQGPVNEAYVEDLAGQLRATYGLEVRIAPQIPASRETYDATRGQYDGTAIVGALKTVIPEPHSGNTTVVALMNDDMFTSWKPEWRWAFGARSTFEEGGGWSVISAHRMAGVGAARRMLVMVGKYIGGIACGFEERPDKSSIMYNRILSADDLDRMGAVACYR